MFRFCSLYQLDSVSLTSSLTSPGKIQSLSLSCSRLDLAILWLKEIWRIYAPFCSGLTRILQLDALFVWLDVLAFFCLPIKVRLHTVGARCNDLHLRDSCKAIIEVIQLPKQAI